MQVVRLARECGLVKLGAGAVAVDGTKLMANASRHKAMSYDRMVKAEAELKGQIASLINRAKAADDLEKSDPDLDIPDEIKRREDQLAVITAAKQRLEQRQQEADLARGRSQDDERKPRNKNGKPKGGRYKCDFGVPKDSAQESFTNTVSRIMKRAGGGQSQPGRGRRAGSGRYGLAFGGGVRAAQGQPERDDRGAVPRRHAGTAD